MAQKGEHKGDGTGHNSQGKGGADKAHDKDAHNSRTASKQNAGGGGHKG